MRSPIYWHPYTYRLMMKILYGSHFEDRYMAIAALIPENSSVVEVCAGDGYLYEHYLSKKVSKYTGLDLNPDFVSAAKKKGIPMQLHDLTSDQLPSAEYVLIHASLYQFIPGEKKIIQKLLSAATNALIVAEPIRNLADSDNSIIRLLAKYSANPGKEHATKRFNRESLLSFFRGFPEFRESIEVKGGRELIGIFRK